MSEQKPREWLIHTDCNEFSTSPSTMKADRKFDVHVIEFSAYEALRSKFENSEHEVAKLREENKRLRADLWRINRAMSWG